MLGFLWRFIRCVENLVIVALSIGIQFHWWIVHQTWKLAYVGIKKELSNKWTYDYINHLMKNLGTLIALASMTYIIGVVDLNAYELHLWD